MSDGQANAPPLPLELRVHGVGGPQAVKMLGELHESDIVTVPSPAADGQTRFAQRIIRGRTEAYEWGGLNAASLAKALWVLYLPFTLVNAGGWAHAAEEDTGANQKARWTPSAHRALAHLAAYLATLTYVAWIGYLTLQLVGRVWVDHVRTGNEAEGALADVIGVWTPRLAPVACAVLVGGLLLAPSLRGRFEEVQGDDAATPWPRVVRIADPLFFARKRRYQYRLYSHAAVGGTGLAAVLLQYMVGWNQLGAVLLAIAGVQGVVLMLLAMIDLAGRWWRTPVEVFPVLVKDDALDNPGAVMPMGAALVSIGTALAHAAFAGLAMTLSPLLARWPENLADDVLPVGAELAASDVLAWVLVLFVAFTGVILVRSPRAPTETTVAGTANQGAVVRLARQTPKLALAALVAFAIPVAVAVTTNAGDLLDSPSDWYRTYGTNQGSIARRLGSFVLVLLPGVVYKLLSGQHDSGVGRVIGNLWDVLTFWPRRFHPYAAPCSAERSVPELRKRIADVIEGLDEDERLGMVVVAHSQGSVLSAAAIASLPAETVPPSLVTFGSPLGTLYAPAWPAYIPPLTIAVRGRIDADQPGRPWVNFWRITDPIGAEVPSAGNEHLLEPQAPVVDDPTTLRQLRPLERPPRWGSVVGHSNYLSDGNVREAIRRRRADGGATA